MAKVRLWQVETSDSEPIAVRRARVLEALPSHAAACDILVLPELWLTGAFNLKNAAEHALPFNNDLLPAIADIAAQTNTYIHAGSFALANAGEKAFNTAVLFGPSGHEIARYRKQHLFGFADGERTVIQPSTDVSITETPAGNTALTICYDLRFPEQYRTLVDANVETFLTCAGWPAVRLDAWDVLNRARAIENQTFVIACNGRGVQGEVTLGGQSLVVAPTGEVITRASQTDEYIDAEIDVTAVAQWREQFPVLKDRI